MEEQRLNLEETESNYNDATIRDDMPNACSYSFYDKSTNAQSARSRKSYKQKGPTSKATVSEAQNISSRVRDSNNDRGLHESLFPMRAQGTTGLLN